MGSAGSPNRDFESYVRILVGLDEDDVQLILKQFNSFLSLLNYHLAFNQSKIFQPLFTPWEIMKQLCKLNIMILV